MVTKELTLTDAYRKSYTGGDASVKAANQSFRSVMDQTAESAKPSKTITAADNGVREPSYNTAKRAVQGKKPGVRPTTKIPLAPVSDAVPSAEDAAAVVDVSALNAVLPVTAETIETLTKAEAAVVEEIAAITDKPTEVVAEIFASMNVSPLQITEPDVMRTFVREVVDVEDDVSLLSVPGIVDVTRPLQQLAERIAPVAEAHRDVSAAVNAEATRIATEDVDVAPAENAPAQAVNVAAAENTPTAEARKIAETPLTVEQAVKPEIVITTTIRQKAAQSLSDRIESAEAEQGNVAVDTDAVVPKVAYEAFSQGDGLNFANEQRSAANDDGFTDEQQADNAGINAAQAGQTAQSADVSATSKPQVDGTNATRPDDVSAVDTITTRPDAQGSTAAPNRDVTATATQPPRPVNQAAVINQIMDRLKVEVKADVTTEIKMTLRPEHLGDVTMKIVTRNGIVTAEFTAENQRVKELIESGFTDLRERLKEQGVTVEELFVSVGDGDGGGQSSYQNQPNANATFTQRHTAFDEPTPEEIVPSTTASGLLDVLV